VGSLWLNRGSMGFDPMIALEPCERNTPIGSRLESFQYRPVYQRVDRIKPTPPYRIEH
jgi:hypothetical protein